MRRLVIPFSRVLVSAPQDLVGVRAAAGKFARILRVWVAGVDQTLPVACDLALAMAFLSPTVIPGSGGSNNPPQLLDQGDGSPQSTAWQNATTPASTSGSLKVLWPSGCHIYQGLDLSFPEPLAAQNGEAWVFSLLGAPASAAFLSGGMLIEEIGA